jgi:hypothetical protein
MYAGDFFLHVSADKIKPQILPTELIFSDFFLS